MFGSMKSWTRVRTGSPFGWYSLPAFEYSPTSSFFFVSTLMTGSPAAKNEPAVELM